MGEMHGAMQGGYVPCSMWRGRGVGDGDGVYDPGALLVSLFSDPPDFANIDILTLRTSISSSQDIEDTKHILGILEDLFPLP